MSTPIHKSLTLFSLLALVAMPLMASAAVYGEPITINNPTPAESDIFGSSVSISGDKVLIGAQLDDTGATNAGSAYLFDATTGALLQTFNNPTSADYDAFGAVVSISGDKVLIGALNDNTGATNAGSAYLYDATTGALLQTFNNPTPAAYDYFGYSVSISGDKILIGAHNDNTGADNAGSAYLYDATTGALLQTFNNPTPTYNESFGRSVSISGDKVLIGALFDDTGADNTGSAYLFDATTGALIQTFNNPTPENYDSFGISVSISGDKVLVGAHEDNTGADNAGSAYLYDATTGALLHTFNNPAPALSDVFGNSVSISGDKVLISAPNDDTGATGAGSAYLFDATTGALLQTFNNPTPAFGDVFGTVSISGDKVLIGAYGDDTGATNAGSAYLYLPDTDTDSDGIFDSTDNCPGVVNAGQEDTDSDGLGNVCDTTPNGDTDGDGVDNLTDNCPADPNTDQTDTDGDGEGNVCDPTPNGDTDNDGVDNLTDNCPAIANPDQTDTDGDGLGDACDLTPPQEVAALVDLVEVFNLQQGIANNLDAKLDAALNALNDVNANNDQAAINSLQAFISSVEAQRGNKITNEQADTLIAAAQAIIDSLSL